MKRTEIDSVGMHTDDGHGIEPGYVHRQSYRFGCVIVETNRETQRNDENSKPWVTCGYRQPKTTEGTWTEDENSKPWVTCGHKYSQVSNHQRGAEGQREFQALGYLWTQVFPSVKTTKGRRGTTRILSSRGPVVKDIPRCQTEMTLNKTPTTSSAGFLLTQVSQVEDNRVKVAKVALNPSRVTRKKQLTSNH